MNLTVIYVSVLFILSILALSCILAKNNDSGQMNNWTKFECGFNLMTPSHIPFSFQFFLIALLFLIFDVEISMLLAYPLEVESITKSSTIFFFLIVLAIGLLYEWNNGNIDWSE